MSLDALQDLFARVRERATGVWKVGQDPHRTIFLDGGQIVFAQSTHPLDRLTHLLVERGKLTQAQMDYALENLAAGLSIGRNLIQMGFITQRDLLDVARFQVERVVWGALGSEGLNAEFEAKDLDNSVVRLALDTPSLLLGGLLNLQDRERMLELLGPLDQVLELQVKPPESCLPLDLAKVPSLFDGWRSLLELAREAGAEPMRLGALALFLKELHWAKGVEASPPLPEIISESMPTPPPMLVVEAPALSETLPRVVPQEHEDGTREGSPRRTSLIEDIQAAQQPTEDLEHISAKLDHLEESLSLPAPVDLPQPAPDREPPPLVAPIRPIPAMDRDDDEITAENIILPGLPESHDGVSWHVEVGQALLPEPRDQVPFEAAEEPQLSVEPLEPVPEAFPSLSPAEPGEDASPVATAPDFETRHRKGKGGWFLGLVLLLVGAGSGFAWLKLRPGAESVVPPRPAPPSQVPARTPPLPAPPDPSLPGPARAAPVTAPAVEASPAPLTPEKKPLPAPAVAPAASKAETAPANPDQRWTALKAGRLDQALAQGRAHLKSQKGDRWTIRLEIACQVETLQNAAEWMAMRNKDLFVLPMTMKSGQTCHQLFVGAFASKAEAEAEIPRLPAQFRQGGNKPRAFQISEIPSSQ